MSGTWRAADRLGIKVVTPREFLRRNREEGRGNISRSIALAEDLYNKATASEDPQDRCGPQIHNLFFPVTKIFDLYFECFQQKFVL
jgi:hypothetical protein